MLVSKYICDEIKTFPSMPKYSSNIIKRFKADDVEIIFQKAPVSVSGEDLVFNHYAMQAMYEDNVIFIVTLESFDLRSLANELHLSVKELRDEYGVRGNLSKGEIVLYSEDRKETVEVYEEEMKDEVVLSYLMEYTIDALSLDDDEIEEC